MTSSYALPANKARVCRVAGAVFLLFAALNLTGVAIAGLSPGELSGRCGETGCAWTARAQNLLPEDDRTAVAATPATRERFETFARRPVIRLGLAGAQLLALGPFSLLLLGVGLALRRLGGDAEDPLARALPWLRLASLAAIASALGRPLADSLTAMLLAPGTPAGPHWYIVADLGEIGIALMLATAAYAAVWAVEAGVRARRDLADFV